jgi:hypothetical protein
MTSCSSCGTTAQWKIEYVDQPTWTRVLCEKHKEVAREWTAYPDLQRITNLYPSGIAQGLRIKGYGEV